MTAIAAAVAIGLGIYAVSLNGQLDDSRAALSAQQTAAGVLADANATTVNMNGGSGKVVVDDAGTAVLVLECPSVRTGGQDLSGVGDHGQHAGLGRRLRPDRRSRRRSDSRRPCPRARSWR